MSEHLDRQRRRDIRRAMGPEALDLVQQEMRIMVELDARLSLLEQHLARVGHDLERLRRQETVWVDTTRTRGDRLRWLLWGRR